MTDKGLPEWETVKEKKGQEIIRRLRVDGGYLYESINVTNWDETPISHFNMIFVPDSHQMHQNNNDFTKCTTYPQPEDFPTVNQILSEVAQLSQKINKMQSDLREFEKQRVNPKFEECNSNIDRLIGIGKDLVERIEKL